MTTEKIQQVQAYSSPNWNWYAWLWGTTNSVIAASVTAKPALVFAPWPTGLPHPHQPPQGLKKSPQASPQKHNSLSSQ